MSPKPIKPILSNNSVIVDTNKLERIQRREARFITGEYKSRDEVYVKKMLAELELESLQSR